MANFYVGKGIKTFIKPLPDGVETEPVPFTATLKGVFTQLVTVTAGATSGTYGLTNSGVTVSVTATAQLNTPQLLAEALAAAINASATFGAKAGTAKDGSFKLYDDATFGATAAGTKSADITVGTVSAAGDQPHPKGATLLYLTAPLPVGAFLLKGEFLGFEDDRERTILVQISAQLDSTATVGVDDRLSVYAIVADIKAGAAESAPYRLGGRTNANLERGGNRVSSVTFDDDAFERGLTTSLNANLSFEGNWVPSDAGYANAEFFFWGDSEKEIEPIQQFYFTLEMPNTDKTVYRSGRKYQGPGSVSNMPLTGPADGIITSNISAAFNGRPKVKEPEVL